MTVSTPADDEVVAAISGFKWGMNYSFSIKYGGGHTISGVIATVDRKRDVIDITLPEYVIKLNDVASGYNMVKDTYTGPKEYFSGDLFDAFVTNKIINADPENPDFSSAAAFVAKEGKLTAGNQEGDSDLLAFGDVFAMAKITPSSKLKETWEGDKCIVRHVYTYCGQLVKLIQPLRIEFPDYDYLHLNYYTFNPGIEVADFITRLEFEGNDGSVQWWTQVYPSYFITKGGEQWERVSNRYGLTEFDIAYIDLAELAFNVVDGDDNIMDDADVAAAMLSVRFTYAGQDQGSKPLPAADVTPKYKVYDDLWVGGSVFHYRTNEKGFIPVRGILAVVSGDALFEIPTRFDRPKASVKQPDIMLDYSSYALVAWRPFKVAENLDFEIVLDEKKVYQVPLLKELRDNRPNGVSYYVIKDGAWEVGNVPFSDAQAGIHTSSSNGYVMGITAYDAYGINPDTDFKCELKDNLSAAVKKLISVQMVGGVPHICVDNTTQTSFPASSKIGVTLELDNPWDVVRYTFDVTVKRE